MDKLVLVDTSIWIDYFRKQKRVYEEVSRLMDETRVCLARLILAELIQGAKSDREITILKDMPNVFRVLEEGPSIWEKAGLLSYRLKRQGKTVSLGDCYIATLAHENDVLVFTRDKDFEAIKTVVNLSIFSSVL